MVGFGTRYQLCPEVSMSKQTSRDSSYKEPVIYTIIGKGIFNGTSLLCFAVMFSLQSD